MAWWACPQGLSSSSPPAIAIPIELYVHPWAPPQLLGSSSKHTMHDTSSTWNRLLTSLEGHRNKPHLIRSEDAPEIISDILALLLFVILTDSPSFWRRVRWFIAKPESSLDLADSLSFLAECLVNYRDNIVQTYKIHRKFILNQKIMKQVLLCSLQYSLSSKHNFNTKKYILILT